MKDQKGGGLSLTRNQSLLLLFGTLLLCGLSFTLGYLVNSDENESVATQAIQGGSPHNYKSREPVASQKGRGNPDSAKTVTSSAENKSDLVKESELTFFKALSEVPSQVKEAPADEEDIVPPVKVKSVVKKLLPVKNMRHIKAPSAEVGKMLTVQVASFRKREDAFALKNRLERRGYDSYIMIYSKNNTKWFRVRVGAFASKEEARSLSKRLEVNEKLSVYIAKYTR